MGRPKSKKPVETVGASMFPHEVQQLDAIAESRQWTRAFVSGRAAWLGLQIFQMTGSFELPAQFEQDVARMPDGRILPTPPLQLRRLD